jgi:alkylation response protein AidB-like acyl-CoA dehydrogenase
MLVAGGMSHQEAELKGVEEFAVECSILKVYVSDIAQKAADEGIQILEVWDSLKIHQWKQHGEMLEFLEFMKD